MVVDHDNYFLSIVRWVYRVLSMKSRLVKFCFFSIDRQRNSSSEVLRDCSLDTTEVQKDDIIILSSDGLWDVIKHDQLQAIMERNTPEVEHSLSRIDCRSLFSV